MTCFQNRATQISGSGSLPFRRALLGHCRLGFQLGASQKELSFFPSFLSFFFSLYHLSLAAPVSLFGAPAWERQYSQRQRRLVAVTLLQRQWSQLVAAALATTWQQRQPLLVAAARLLRKPLVFQLGLYHRYDH